MKLVKTDQKLTGYGKRVILEFQEGNKIYDIIINPDDLSSPNLGSDSFNVYNKQGQICGVCSFLSEKDAFQGTFDDKEFMFLKDEVIDFIYDENALYESRVIFAQYYRHRSECGGYQPVSLDVALEKITEAYNAEICNNKLLYPADLLKDYQIHALWHFCELKNLSSILKFGLISREKLKSNKISYSDISDPEIQKTRFENNYHKSAPLLFANSPPIVYRLQMDNKIENIVALEINPDILFINEIKVTDKNAGGKYEYNISDDLNEILPRIKWRLIQLQPDKAYQFNVGEEQPLRGAEVLVFGMIPPQFIKGVHVFSNITKYRVDDIAKESGRDVRVEKSMAKGGVKTENLFLEENG